ncbi:hypothetical protein [Rhodobacter xanthinilyticus]|uniref:hypothetical protein n=1 Tax=Rhodobacter xanthinilyticus TaxID=1850250 RepID=UPI0018DD63AA|nr:hypothetical protein [Rhodobacter xanthinilyticus]
MYHPIPETSGFMRQIHRIACAATHFGADKTQQKPRATEFPNPRSDGLYSLNIGPDEAIVLIGPQLDRARDWIEAQQVAVLTVPSLSRIRSPVLTGRKISHLVVDIDYFGGVWEIFDELRRIRNTLPEVAVVLVSHDFSQDDFRCDRLAIYDAALRAPYSLASMEFGLTEAGNVNNPIWQRRLRELQENERNMIAQGNALDTPTIQR